MRIQDALNLLNLNGESFTQEEIKKAYKKASIKYHPDRNPAGLEMMKAINAAYDFLVSLNKTVTSSDQQEFTDYAEELNDILNKLYALELPEIEIEVCGNWIWISGTKREHAPLLNKKDGIGLGWAKTKKKWFYKPSDYVKLSRREYSMNEIRDMHGSQVLRRYARKELAA
ncbi:DnaJ domain-containing protein [Vibrio jasicida]|uniref:DnaJ domain-containing protein n=1 Tax=Vibrio jasicida TaxID=766224 RepID=UPI0005EEECB3|nr:DnaJ domain-containing protein [Vibrio jasicida]